MDHMDRHRNQNQTRNTNQLTRNTNQLTRNQKIKAIREKLGFSQEYIGKRIDLSGAHVSRLETGKSVITDAILEKYIEAFCVDREWVYGNEMEKADGPAVADDPVNTDKLENTDDPAVADKLEKADGSPIFIDKDLNENVSTRIQELRLSLGMSQKKFAEFTGVQQADINRVEAGKTRLGPLSLKRIAEACHVGVDWIQNGDESRKSYPVDDQVIDYLWKNEDIRKELYRKMGIE